MAEKPGQAVEAHLQEEEPRTARERAEVRCSEGPQTLGVTSPLPPPHTSFPALRCDAVKPLDTGLHGSLLLAPTWHAQSNGQGLLIAAALTQVPQAPPAGILPL